MNLLKIIENIIFLYKNIQKYIKIKYKTMSTDDQIIRADNLLKEGQKKLKSKNIFGSLFGYYNKYEDAIESFTKAANLYKMHKKYESAKECFELMINCYTNLNDQYNICETYINIYECLKHYDTNKSIDCIKTIINLYFDQCNSQKICKWYNILGDINDKEGNIDEAMNAYGQMIEYDDGSQVGVSVKLKLANYLAETKQYDKAIDAYQKLIKIYENMPLLKYSIQSMCSNIIILHLCLDDVVNSKRILEKFKNTFIYLEKCKDFLFIEELINFYEQYNVESFVNCVREYDTLYTLDTLKLNLLLEIKKNIDTV